jgi:hypothetical protein
MLAIADIAHKNGVAFPSVATLARFIRMSERNTIRVIAKCEESDELEVRRNAGPHGTHVFRVKMNLTLPLFEGGDKLSSDNLSGDKAASKGVTKTHRGGDTAMSPEPKEQKHNREERAARATRLPKDFGISDNVRAWAKAKGWESFLPAYLETFKRKCEARGAKYADWDRAFENCIADDWGDIRRNAERISGAPMQSRVNRLCAYCDKTSTSAPNGTPACEEHFQKALFHEPTPKKVTS